MRHGQVSEVTGSLLARGVPGRAYVGLSSAAYGVRIDTIQSGAEVHRV